jgi:translation initiation factor 1A
MSRKKDEQAKQDALQQEIARIKMPRGDQTFGIIEQRLGGNRMKVRCLDGKTRICRIPGRHKRKLWVREGDFTIVEPWEYLGDTKGDIIFKYRPTQVIYLKRKGHLKTLEEAEEF